MKDKRDKLIPEQLSGYTWELSGYAPKVPFSNSDSLTMREVKCCSVSSFWTSIP